MADTQMEIGHHGTYLDNLQSIVENNFFETIDHNEWLGDGVYFFVKSFWDTPIDSAKKFALDERFRDRGALSEEEICVIQANIVIDNDKYLNLDKIEGVELFNYFRDELWAKIELSGKKPTTPLMDCDILKKIRKEVGIEFVKKSVFIKFGEQRRKGFIASSVPNVTIFVVNNPNKNIDINSISRVY
jgi:hypothetical protein